MKKYLLQFIFLLPALLFAQDDPALYKEFYKSMRGASSIVLNDHVNVMQVNVDNENFDVLAVNDQMQVLWRTSCTGYAFKVVKFKDKVVAIASTDHGKIKGSNNTYKAFLIDPANGKLLFEKVIYTGNDGYLEFPAVFTGDGSYLKFCVRQCAFERRLHIGLPVFTFISMDKYTDQYNETREMTVVTLNEKLDVTQSFKPPVANGKMASWCCSNQGDLFITWLNGPTLETYQFKAGSTSPEKQLNADVEFKEKGHILVADLVTLLPSKTDNNVLYFGLTYSNPDKDDELGIGKFDFLSGKKTFVKEAFNKQHVKALQKSFVTVNKKLGDADLGYRENLRIRYMAEANGTVITALTARSSASSTIGSGSWATENAVLINGYDEALTLKFQQLLPVIYTVPYAYMPLAYHASKNKFYVVNNNKTGFTKINGVVGCLDLNSGKWDKMDLLSKKKIDNSDYLDSAAVMWFANNYIVPYVSSSGQAGGKGDMTLQQNSY